jgi:hypothetical protein
VSTSVSPFTTLEVAIATFSVSALRTFLGHLERGASPRARLEEQVHHRAPAQRRHFLDGPVRNLLHRLGGVEDEHDLLGREVGDPEQVAVLQARRRRLGRPRVEGRVTPHRTG